MPAAPPHRGEARRQARKPAEPRHAARITFQGRFLQFEQLHVRHLARGGGKRGCINEFTNQARLRMLKLIAKVRWPAALPAVMITLTYPSREGPFTSGEFNLHRKLFLRYVESDIGKNVCGVWRIEWLPRKSGKHKGILYPHHHFLLFSVRYIDKDNVNEYWKRCIHWRKYLRTETKRAGTAAEAACYVAKYCGKVDSSLVDDAYVRRVPNHRHWGPVRGNCIPLAMEQVAEIPEGDLLELFRAVARKEWWQSSQMEGGFTLLGPGAKRAAEIIFGKTK